MNTPLVFVDGHEGTTGLKIHQLLAQRSDLTLIQIDPDKRKDPQARAAMLNQADIAFLCLPDAASKEAATLTTNPKTCLIDASTAHRIDPAWAYGLPELSAEHRDAIRTSTRISNPGCHATGFILLAHPLVKAGVIAPDTVLSATSITGYSGGGKTMIADYEAKLSQPWQPDATEVLMAPRPYGLSLAHKHLPEMRMHSGLSATPIFMPIVAPFAQGLTVSIPLPLKGLNADGAHLQATLAAHYAGQANIRVHALNPMDALDGGFFPVQSCNNTNRVDLFVFASSEQAILMARLDNLGKGASGAAIQSMNIHLGLPENTGLSL
ncbi:N-acetyl-gamma-glutamyl-phosphate reductase [Amphibiibacter pelophylacis]|uniref:N-acetyl-gamma-glutamyl-phosphate reductase n=1 Tax=Amphibiibacter pelophylacis TaxID=1799477 RepID=A0ACC6P1I8_9BURK